MFKKIHPAGLIYSACILVCTSLVFTSLVRLHNAQKKVISIGTVVIKNPKTGDELKYQVEKFLSPIDAKRGYCSFKTTDGKVVEVVETEVTEK